MVRNPLVLLEIASLRRGNKELTPGFAYVDSIQVQDLASFPRAFILKLIAQIQNTGAEEVEREEPKADSSVAKLMQDEPFCERIKALLLERNSEALDKMKQALTQKKRTVVAARRGLPETSQTKLLTLIIGQMFIQTHQKDVPMRPYEGCRIVCCEPDKHSKLPKLHIEISGGGAGLDTSHFCFNNAKGSGCHQNNIYFVMSSSHIEQRCYANNQGEECRTKESCLRFKHSIALSSNLSLWLNAIFFHNASHSEDVATRLIRIIEEDPCVERIPPPQTDLLSSSYVALEAPVCPTPRAPSAL
jgi:hypothetical protein